MKILFTAWAWPSHYFPMVPLAWACRCAGHEVRVASQPALAETIAASGLPAVLVGQDTDLAAMFRQDLTPLIGVRAPAAADARDRTSRAFGIFIKIAEAMADDLITFALGWRPDLVVYDPITFAGPIAAAVAGVPSVRHLWGPDFMARGRSATAARPPDRAGLARLLARFGLTALDLAGTMTVDPCPPSLQVPTTPGTGSRRSMRYVPYNGPGIAPSRLPPGRHICVTWGTSTLQLTGEAGFLPPEVIRAASESGAGVIVAVTAQQRGLLGNLPEGVRIAESVPLHLLLPQCDAVIHQGGAGTMLTSAVCGLAQLVIPQLPDQAFNARQLAGAGAGRILPRAELTADALRAHLAALLDEPSHAQAAGRLRREITAQPSPADIVGALEEQAAGGTLVPPLTQPSR